MPVPERCSRFAEHRNRVLQLFATRGFSQVGMRELATNLGISPGSMYHHYPSKQHLLLDLIEEFYEELLATLGRIERQAPAKRDRLDSLIRAHLSLHQEMPWHFRLAERDSGCLNEEQQAQVLHLREQYEHKLLLMLGPEPFTSDAARRATARASAALLNTAPSWLAQYPLDERERDSMVIDIMGGALERLLSPKPRIR